MQVVQCLALHEAGVSYNFTSCLSVACTTLGVLPILSLAAAELRICCFENESG